MKPLDPPPLELTIAEAAEYLGVSPKTIRAYLADGSLIARDASPLGRTRRLLRIPLAAVIELRGAYASQAVEKKPAHVSKRRAPAWEPKILKVRRPTS